MSNPVPQSWTWGSSIGGEIAIIAAAAVGQLPWKKPVDVASTADVDLSTDLAAGGTIDGETLIAGWRVLVWQQPDASQNGIYEVPASGAASRTADFDADAEIRGAIVAVLQGTAYGGKAFHNTNTTAIVVDTDDITFELFAAGATSIPFDHGDMGATETFDLADGDWQRATFDANCTITLLGFSVDVGATMLIEFTIGGVGGYSATWDPDIVWIGNDQPPQTVTDVGFVMLWTSQGDSLIYAAWIGAGGLTVKDEGVALATLAEALDFVGAGVTASGTGTGKTITISGVPQGAAGGDLAGTYPNPTVSASALAAALPSGLRGELLISDTPSTPLVFADLIQNEVQDDLVYADL